MSTLRILYTIIKQVDQYRRYGLWRGSSINAHKLPLAAWKMVTKPKVEGGLGVIRLKLHNNALLMKQLQKFLNKEDLPWVNLLWANYYQANNLQISSKKGSFWWRDIIKLWDIDKGIASVKMGDGSRIRFWEDSYNGCPLSHQFPELYSFAKSTNIHKWNKMIILQICFISHSVQKLMSNERLLMI